MSTGIGGGNLRKHSRPVDRAERVGAAREN